jgi:hypothetical protein
MPVPPAPCHHRAAHRAAASLAARASSAVHPLCSRVLHSPYVTRACLGVQSCFLLLAASRAPSGGHAAVLCFRASPYCLSDSRFAYDGDDSHNAAHESQETHAHVRAHTRWQSTGRLPVATAHPVNHSRTASNAAAPVRGVGVMLHINSFSLIEMLRTYTIGTLHIHGNETVGAPSQDT